jgi:signal peptidase I
MALLLIEAGVQHECRIDLTSGQATATVSLDGKSVDAFDVGDGKLAATASVATSVRAGSRHRLKFANVDDTLILWIDGKHLPWKGDMMTLAYLPLTARVPKTTPTDPLDAAPVGIGLDGGSAELTRVQVYRDIYYIAQGNQNQSLYDYREISTTLRDSSSPANNERYAREVHDMSASELVKQMSQEGLLRNAILTNPTLWAQSPFARNRQVVDFPMQDDWYFPMGDNSSASADARSWGHTPERLMIGRAVMVFWPHYWNAPIPFVPNVQRMGLIR